MRSLYRAKTICFCFFSLFSSFDFPSLVSLIMEGAMTMVRRQWNGYEIRTGPLQDDPYTKLFLIFSSLFSLSPSESVRRSAPQKANIFHQFVALSTQFTNRRSCTHKAPKEKRETKKKQGEWIRIWSWQRNEAQHYCFFCYSFSTPSIFMLHFGCLWQHASHTYTHTHHIGIEVRCDCDCVDS